MVIRRLARETTTHKIVPKFIIYINIYNTKNHQNHFVKMRKFLLYIFIYIIPPNPLLLERQLLRRSCGLLRRCYRCVWLWRERSLLLRERSGCWRRCLSWLLISRRCLLLIYHLLLLIGCRCGGLHQLTVDLPCLDAVEELPRTLWVLTAVDVDMNGNVFADLKIKLLNPRIAYVEHHATRILAVLMLDDV